MNIAQEITHPRRVDTVNVFVVENIWQDGARSFSVHTDQDGNVDDLLSDEDFDHFPTDDEIRALLPDRRPTEPPYPRRAPARSNDMFEQYLFDNDGSKFRIVTSNGRVQDGWGQLIADGSAVFVEGDDRNARTAVLVRVRDITSIQILPETDND